MSHAETPKTGARNADQPAPRPEPTPTPTSAEPSEPLTVEAVEKVRATLHRLSQPLETLTEQLAKLNPVDGCPCMICAHVARVHAHLERTDTP